MIKIIVGENGNGKTKQLLKMANEAAKSTKGHIVFIDDDHTNMYNLDHNIRYIEATEFPLRDFKEFFGFICGILSEDFDIDYLFIDNLLKLTNIDISSATDILEEINKLSDKFNVKFIMSLRCKQDLVPDNLKEYLVA